MKIIPTNDPCIEHLLDLVAMFSQGSLHMWALCHVCATPVLADNVPTLAFFSQHIGDHSILHDVEALSKTFCTSPCAIWNSWDGAV